MRTWGPSSFPGHRKLTGLLPPLSHDDVVSERVEPWKSTVRGVLAVLNDVDPYGLDPGKPDGAPLDEYDLEAEPIAKHLVDDGSITVEQVDAIWRHWFSESLSGPGCLGRSATEQFVARLNELMNPTPSPT